MPKNTKFHVYIIILTSFRHGSGAGGNFTPTRRPTSKQNPKKSAQLAYKKQRNLCLSIRRKSITNCLNKFTDKGLETNKCFWKFIKPFLTNKGTLTDCDITIVDGKKIISDDFELAKTFNNHYINTVEINSGFNPLKIPI